MSLEKVIGVAILLLALYFGYRFVDENFFKGGVKNSAPTDSHVIDGIDASGKLRYLTTDWESLHEAPHTVTAGEICYGDNVRFDGKNHTFHLVRFGSAKEIVVTWGACTHEPYTLGQVKVFLQEAYTKRPGNWEQVLDVP